MVGILKPDYGDVLVGGYSIEKDPISVKKQIGLAPQEIALFESFTATENLEYWGGLYGLKGNKLKKKIGEAIEIAGLNEHIKKKVKNYSGGMKRRLNIVAAMMHNPEILVMDEPTVGVDPQSRNYIFQIIKKTNRDYNTTIIYTSHYMEEIEHLCNRVFIMDRGKEVAFGNKEQLKRMIQNNRIIRIKASGDLDNLMLNLKKDIRIRLVEMEEQEIKIITDTDFNINFLLDEIQTSKVEIKTLRIDEPSLEEIFLTLTGKKLKDRED